jgi:hypothetical protein
MEVLSGRKTPPSIMLNPDLDLAALEADFARERRIRIPAILPQATALAVAEEMASLPYKQFCGTKSGFAVLDPEAMAGRPASRRAELDRFLADSAEDGVGFVHHGKRLTEDWATGAPATPLGKLFDWMNSSDAQTFVRAITGPSDINGAYQQAPRYMPGHYLTKHLDDPANESRRIAVVWGFTQPWLPDWGGLLQLFSPDGAPAEAFAPGFNTLDLFEVRHWHSFTYVAPFARAPRLAVSGWFIRRPS